MAKSTGPGDMHVLTHRPVCQRVVNIAMLVLLHLDINLAICPAGE
jgi:hypothetical protein